MSDAARDPRKAAWRRDDSEFAPVVPSERRSLAKSRQLYFLVALLLGLVGVLLATVEYLRPTPPTSFVTLAVREYGDPRLPPNAFAVQDSRRLFDLFPGEKYQDYSKQNRDVLEKALYPTKELEKSPTIVFHLSALAYVQEEGDEAKGKSPEGNGILKGNRVLILPADASPGDDEARAIPLAEFLAKISAWKATNKLVILDIMHPVADARLGVLSDRVAEFTQDYLESLEKRTDEKEKLKCFVLTACSAGQLSLVSAELRSTIFAYYIEEGLRGYADGFGDKGRKDGHISVQELGEFVKFRVNRWSWLNRRTMQTPRLFGGDLRDFTITQFDRAYLVKEEEKLAEWKYPDWLKAGWTLADEWSKARVYRQLPQTFARLRFDLMRAESKWRAGFEEDRAKEDLAPTLDVATREFKASLAIPPLKLGSVVPSSMAGTDAAKVRAELEAIQKALTNLLPRALEPKDKLDEADKKSLEELGKSKKEILDRLKKQTPGDGVNALISTAASVPNLSPGKLLVLLDMLADLKANYPAETRLHESLQLERLGEFWKTVQEYGSEWPTRLVNRSLKLGLKANETLALLAKDPIALEFVEEKWNRAEQQRQQGETSLFGGRMSQWRNAEPSFQEAENLYQEISSEVRTIASARLALDHGLTLLPYALGPSLSLARWEPGPPLERNLKEAASTVRQLTTAFHPLEKRPTTDFELSRRLTRSVEAMPGITDVLLKKWRAGENTDPDPSYWAEMQALLTLPNLSAADREFLFKQQNSLALKLHKTARDRDDEENTEGVLKRITLGEDTGLRNEAFRSQLRVLNANLMLDAGDVRLVSEIKDKKGNPVPMEDGAFLRSFARFSKHGVKERFSSAKLHDVAKDTLGRVFADLDFRELNVNPTKKLRDAKLQRFRDFHVKRYEKEAKAWEDQSVPLARTMAEIADTLRP